MRRRGYVVLGTTLSCLLALAPPNTAEAADKRSPHDRLTTIGDAVDVRRRAKEAELEALRRSLGGSQKRQEALAAEVAGIEADRARLSRALVDTNLRLRSVEERIARAETRLERLRANEDAVRSSLHARRGVLAQVLAALQRMSRRPPPALLSRPEDALSAIRGSIVASSVMPALRVEALALADDLEELVRLRRAIDAEHEGLKASLASLAEERARIDMLITARQERRSLSESALAAEREKARRLAEQATSLASLIESMEAEATPGGRDAAVTDQALREAERATGGLAPAIAFARAKGMLPRPVAGAAVRYFGQSDAFGSPAKGVTFSTPGGARVAAPADGKIAFAGPYRSYGELLILDAGDGYHIVMAGMERIDVDIGQHVLSGEPVAVMRAEKRTHGENGGVDAGNPTLYVEFRHDGKSIDPEPWWDRRIARKDRG